MTDRTPVPVSVAVTDTFGTTEPEESVTIPEMLPVMPAQTTTDPRKKTTSKAGRNR
jgi:hypothetical protein